jgi:hypothetical protein
VAVQGQEGAVVSSAGEKWVTELHSANERKKKELRGGILEQTRAILEAGSYESEVSKSQKTRRFPEIVFFDFRNCILKRSDFRNCIF